MKKSERYKNIIAWFLENVPVAESELHYQNGYQLLVSVILSAQCTDKRVNMTTPALFDRFPTPQAMADAEIDEIFQYIKSISYPNNKAKNLSGMAKMLIGEFGGVVPDNIEELQKLPGVGRKTANVVGSVLFGREVIAVDTHVFRVSARLGFSPKSKTPLETERELEKNIPKEYLPIAHHWLILHGRYICTARNPKCEGCGIRQWCDTFLNSEKKHTKQNIEKK